MAKHYAKEEGLLATMMPKPFADRTGTGAHFNMSLCDLRVAESVCLLALTTCADWAHRDRLYFSGVSASRGAAVCGICADGQQFTALGSARRHAYFPGTGVQSYGSNNRTNSCECCGWWAVRVAQRRRRGHPYLAVTCFGGWLEGN